MILSRSIALALTYSAAHIYLQPLAHAAKPLHPEATFNAPDFVGLVEQEERRFVVTYKKKSRDFSRRLKRAKGNSSDRDLRANVFSKTRPGGPMFLPKENAEVMYLETDADVQRMSERDDVESVELDNKVYLMNEQVPYGITNVQAFSVPDTNVSNRKVCIVDTGYDLTHPDLTSDPNVVTGYDGEFSAGPSPWSYDGHGHGTHVAGTIAAIGDNGEGVVGVNRNGQVKLHIVKVFGDNGSWAWGSSLVAAVEECVDAGSNIVSMSLGGGGFTNFENNAYNTITAENDVLLIAAAGNGGDTSYLYPASYDAVMSVAAIDSNNIVAGFSQRNDQVDIAAPGVGTLSTLPLHVASSGYSAWSGTSMATPHVSGVAALIWSLDTTRSAAEIREALEVTAQDLGAAGRDNTYGHGLVRADLAAAYLDTDFTLSPTAAPTPAPPCNDNPEGWFDVDGPTYDCAWYAQGSNCAVFGDSYANNGITANMACCACGGGVPDEGTSSPTGTPVAQPTGTPVAQPTGAPVAQPTGAPVAQPTGAPVAQPSGTPVAQPSGTPVAQPSGTPVAQPSGTPVATPVAQPTDSPVATPVAQPTDSPVATPVAQPTDSPVATPVAQPTDSPVLPGECPPGQALMELKVVTDGFGFEHNIYKVVKRGDDNKFKDVVWKLRKMPSNKRSFYETCLDIDACYKSVMIDNGEDGMCCEHGEGGYRATFNGKVVKNTLWNNSFTDGRVSRKKFGNCQ